MGSGCGGRTPEHSGGCCDGVQLRSRIHPPGVPGTLHLVPNQAVQILDDQAAAIRARIRDDRTHNLEPQETTLTQNLVSSLRRELALAGTAVYASEIPRDQEAKLYGADIAVWIRSPAGSLAGIHLQSKRQYLDDTYRDLNHANSYGKQYEMLRAGAQAAGARAGYAFYNGLNDNEPTSAMCARGITSADSHGVSIVGAERIAGYIAARVHRVDIEHLCAPLRCLIGCRTRAELVQYGLAGALLSWQGGDPDVSLVDRVDAPGYLEPLLALAAAADRGDRVRQSPSSASDATGEQNQQSAARAAADDGGTTVTVLLAVPPPGT